MKVVYSYFGLIQRKELSHAEKKIISGIINSYNYSFDERETIMKNLRYIIDSAGTFEEVRLEVLSTMGIRFTRNWERTSKVLVFDKKFWDWLLSIKSEVGFNQDTLDNYSTANGFIGEFNGVQCYVREAMKIKQGKNRKRITNKRH